MSTFAYNGSVYDTTTGDVVGSVPSARLGIRAWVADEVAQVPTKVTPITFKVEAPRKITSYVDPFGEDETPAREPLSGFLMHCHREKVHAFWRLCGSMSLDPSETSDAEVQALDSVPVFGMHGSYETTPDSALLDCKARFIVHPSGWVSERPANGWLKHGFRRTFALDSTMVEASPQDGRQKVTEAVCDKNGRVIIHPKRYWRNVLDGNGRPTWETVSPEILPYDKGVEDDVMAWIHRDDIEVNRARRSRLEDTGDSTREWIRGAAAPKDLTEFDYERLLSNPDVPVKAQRSPRGRLWEGKLVAQDRAFPGEHNLALSLAQRQAQGDEAVSERMLASWSQSMRHRFNVRRYVEAIASAFDDDPREVFAVIEAGRLSKSTSWAKVEAHVARQYAEFAESCYLSGVSDGCAGEWLSTGDDAQSAEWRMLVKEHGFGTEYADQGHSLFQTRLTHTHRPRLHANPDKARVVIRDRATGDVLEVDPKTSGWVRPNKVRVAAPSERGWFTMEEVLKGLLATVSRMETDFHPTLSDEYVAGPSDGWDDTPCACGHCNDCFNREHPLVDEQLTLV